MDQQEAPSTDADMSAIRERLSRLEERVRLTGDYDRAANWQAWHGLQVQMNHLRSEMQLRGFGQPLGMIAWLKILLAILLPYLALLLTGSIEIAHKVASIPAL